MEGTWVEWGELIFHALNELLRLDANRKTAEKTTAPKHINTMCSFEIRELLENVKTLFESRLCFICQGISFLHNMRSPVVHGDFKPSDVLLTAKEGLAGTFNLNLKWQCHEILFPESNPIGPLINWKKCFC